jgi:hypothetical protein
VDDLGGDPQEVDQAMHWYDREPCPFTREEGEVHGTYVASSMSRNEGDDMLKWACNQAYRSRRLRFRNIRSLSRAVLRKYVPEGVKGSDPHDPCIPRNHPFANVSGQQQNIPRSASHGPARPVTAEF